MSMSGIIAINTRFGSETLLVINAIDVNFANTTIVGNKAKLVKFGKVYEYTAKILADTSTLTHLDISLVCTTPNTTAKTKTLSSGELSISLNINGTNYDLMMPVTPVLGGST